MLTTEDGWMPDARDYHSICSPGALGSGELKTRPVHRQDSLPECALPITYINFNILLM